MDFLTLLAAYAVVSAVALFALYWVIRAAVLGALREHTMNSTTAVSVTSAVPLRIADATPRETPASVE